MTDDRPVVLVSFNDNVTNCRCSFRMAITAHAEGDDGHDDDDDNDAASGPHVSVRFTPGCHDSSQYTLENRRVLSSHLQYLLKLILDAAASNGHAIIEWTSFIDSAGLRCPEGGGVMLSGEKPLESQLVCGGEVTVHAESRKRKKATHTHTYHTPDDPVYVLPTLQPTPQTTEPTSLPATERTTEPFIGHCCATPCSHRLHHTGASICSLFSRVLTRAALEPLLCVACN